MNQNEEPKLKRKPYGKPEIRRVQLSPEESLSAGCKLPASGTAPAISPCTANSCAFAGS